MLGRTAALHPAVDDLGGHPEARHQAVLPVVGVGLPGAVDHVQHGGLGRLRIDEEEHGAGQVEPGVRHFLRVVQQGAHSTEHGLGEGAVVVVVRQLLGATTEVTLELAVVELAARPLLTLPHIRPALGVVAAAHLLGPAHLPYPHQTLAPLGLGAPALVATGLLGEVGEHGGQRLAADGLGVAPVAVVAAEGRELGHRLQETAIGVLRRPQRKQEVEL